MSDDCVCGHLRSVHDDMEGKCLRKCKCDKYVDADEREIDQLHKQLDKALEVLDEKERLERALQNCLMSAKRGRGECVYGSLIRRRIDEIIRFCGEVKIASSPLRTDAAAQEAIRERDQLRAELAAAKADSERLDWLEIQRNCQLILSGRFISLDRGGIDAARKEARG